MKNSFFHSILTVLLFQFLLVAPLFGETYLGYSDYQIITDSDFRADKYFLSMAEHGVNFQRIWVTGYSGAAKQIDELMPFARRGNKYRLSEISPVYRERLKEVMEQAESHDLRVMLTLFDHWSLRKVFEVTPWYFKNNEERLLKGGSPSFYDVDNKKLMRIQENLVREIVKETKSFDPIYEIMNEAAGASCAELTEWHEKVASWILEESPDAEIAVNPNIECSGILEADWVDIISFHEKTWKTYGICQSIQRYPDKHVIIDTDGAWEIRDDNRLVKRWLAESRRCGGSFNHKDDIYQLDRQLLRHYRDVTERGEGRQNERRHR
jgi:hypothetical protein